MINNIIKGNIIKCVLTSIIVFAMVTALIFTTIFVWEDTIEAEENGANSSSGTFNLNLENGSFEKNNQGWTVAYKIMNKDQVPSWHTTATDGMIELFRKNTGTYIPGVELTPTDGNIAAELNANEESTLYQNVTTTPSTVYEWGLDHGARNGTDTMALVIGPKQNYDPSKPSKTGRDQLMQMVDWLIQQGKTSVKKSTETGIREKLTVYSKKFAANGTFVDNGDNNAFSLTPSKVHTEQWKIWIIADNKISSSNSWGHYGLNDKNSDSNNNYWQYRVPEDQNVTLFGFVSVGFNEAAVTGDEEKVKTYGNFLDNINFYHPLSISTTAHGSASVKIGDGDTIEIGADKKLVKYVPEGKTMTLQAIVKKEKVDDGCEFAGVYCTERDGNGNSIITFLSKSSQEWVYSTNENGDMIYTYNISDVKTATDLHFVFIKSATITYDTNGGKPYDNNVYSFKPTINGNISYAAPYVSREAVGYDGWKFMGWKLNGDTVSSVPEGTAQHAVDKLGSLILPGVHTIACDYSVNDEAKEDVAQLFKIYEGNVTLNKEVTSSGVKWTGNNIRMLYANIHKGLTLTAQWRWKQLFIPQIKNNSGTYDNSVVGGEIEVKDVSDSNNYEAGDKGVKTYFANANETITAIATAKEGYTFEGWYDAVNGGKCVCEKNKFRYIETKESVNTYYARFYKVAEGAARVKSGLAYTGQPLELVEEIDGSVKGGTLQYSTDGDTYTTEIPTGTDVGEYTTWYKVVASLDSGCIDSEPVKLIASIKKEINEVTFKEPTAEAGEKPVTELEIEETSNYTGAISWELEADEKFALNTKYTATIKLTAKDNHMFKNGVKLPKGWKIVEDKRTETILVLEKEYIAKIIHDWKYSANGAILTAWCEKSELHSCPYNEENKVSLTLATFSPIIYAGNAILKIGNDTERAAWQAAGLKLPTENDIKYYQGETELGVAPILVGDYIAKVAPVGVVATDLNTATISFKINKSEFIILGPIGAKPDKSPSTSTEDLYKGKLDKYVRVAEDAPIENATLDNSKGKLLDAPGVFTKTERDRIANGIDAKVYLAIGGMKSSDIPEADRTKIEDVAKEELGKNFTIEYMDVSLFKQIGEETAQKVYEPGADIEVTMEFPSNMLINKEGEVRKYRILRLHNGVVEKVIGTFNIETNEYCFKTNKFSTYAIAYSDEKMKLEIKTSEDKKTLTKKPTKQEIDDNSNALISKAKATWTNKNYLKLTWGKVKDAAGYEVYVSKCGRKSIWSEKVYETKKGTTVSVTLKKLKGKNFNKVGLYKYAVRAYKYINDKKVYIGESLTYHLIGDKNQYRTNPKKVIAKKKNITVKVKKSTKLSVKVIKVKPKCKIVGHEPLVRYISTNSKVAKVDNTSGKVTGVKKGKCKIYCVAVNGEKAIVDVTVK